MDRQLTPNEQVIFQQLEILSGITGVDVEDYLHRQDKLILQGELPATLTGDVSLPYKVYMHPVETPWMGIYNRRDGYIAVAPRMAEDDWELSEVLVHELVHVWQDAHGRIPFYNHEWMASVSKDCVKNREEYAFGANPKMSARYLCTQHELEARYYTSVYLRDAASAAVNNRLFVPRPIREVIQSGMDKGFLPLADL